MPIAYVLLNCSLGSEEKVIEKLKQIESVKEVNGTFGTYDILAKLQASNIKDSSFLDPSYPCHFQNASLASQGNYQHQHLLPHHQLLACFQTFSGS